MKTLLPLLSAISIVLLSTAAPGRAQVAADIGTDADEGPAIVLVGVGKIDPQLFARVKEYVLRNYGCSVKAIQKEALKAHRLDKKVKELASIGADDICVVAWTLGPIDPNTPGEIFAKDRLAVLDVVALKPAKETGNEASEQYARRMEKETMRLVGSLLGLNECGNVRCAMSRSKGDAELDAKGRNLCPSCRMAAFRLISVKGGKAKPWVPRSGATVTPGKAE